MPNIAEFVANLLQGIKGQKPNPQIGQSSQDVLAGAPQAQQPGLITGLPQTPNLNPQMPLGGPTSLNVQGPNVQTGVGLPPPPQFPQLASRPQDAANVDSTEQQDAIKRLNAQQALIDQDNQQAQSAFQKAQGQLGSEPTPNIGESLGGLIAQFTGPRTPLAFTRAGGAPYELASERLALQNKNALDTMNASRAVLGLNVTRQDALDRTRATMVDNINTQAAKKAIQADKTDAGFWDMVVKQSGTDSPVTAAALGAALQARHPDMSPAAIQQAISSFATDQGTNLNFKQAQERAKSAQTASQFHATMLQKAYSDQLAIAQKSDGDMGTRKQAFWRLQNMAMDPSSGLIVDRETPGAIPAINPAETLETWTQEHSAKTDLEHATADEKTANALKATEETRVMAAKLKPEINAIIQKGSRDAEEAALLTQKVTYFKPEFQARVAKDWAEVGKLSRDAKAPPAAHVDAYKALAGVYEHQIQNLETEKGKYQNNILGSTWTADQEKELQTLKDQQGHVSTTDDQGNVVKGSGVLGALETAGQYQAQTLAAGKPKPGVDVQAERTKAARAIKNGKDPSSIKAIFQQRTGMRY